MTHTCKYCGTDLSHKLECSYCKIIFSSEEAATEHTRESQIIYDIPRLDDLTELIFTLTSKETGDLHKEKTLTLYYLLRAARKAKDHFFKERDQEKLTYFEKKCFVIENILIERTGSFPLSINKNFLSKKFSEYKEFEETLNKKNKATMIPTLLNQ